MTKKIVIELTPKEAEALYQMVSEGHTALVCSDQSLIDSVLGGTTRYANKALKKVEKAYQQAREDL